MFRRLSGSTWFLVTLFTAATSLGQTTVLIVVQRSAMSSIGVCEQRLRAELTAEGYLPTTVQVNEEPNPAVLVDTAKRLSSPAAISIVSRGGTVSGLVWMLDPKRSGGLLRAVAEHPMNNQAPVVFAVSATNVLHGGLLELGYIQEPAAISPGASDKTATPPSGTAATASDPASARPPTPPPFKPVAAGRVEPRPSAAPSSRNAWTLTVGATAKVPFVNAPPALSPELVVSRRLSSSLSTGLVGRIALPVTAEGRRASASVLEIAVGPVIEFRQSLLRSWILFEFLETGLVYAKASGQAASPLESHDAYFYTLYHHGGVGLGWSLTADFTLWARGGLQLAWKKGEVVVVDENVATLSGPSTLLGGGMSLGF
jgi:hypothetical protein